MAKLWPAKHFFAASEANSSSQFRTLNRYLFWVKNENNFLCAARGSFYLLNFAREQKSLATPAL
jgi:hypothetical protein